MDWETSVGTFYILWPHFAKFRFSRDKCCSCSCCFFVQIYLGPVWPDLAKCRQFGQILNQFGYILRVYLVFGTILQVPCQLLYAFGLMFIVVNSHKMKKQIWHLVTLPRTVACLNAQVGLEIDPDNLGGLLLSENVFKFLMCFSLRCYRTNINPAMRFTLTVKD